MLVPPFMSEFTSSFLARNLSCDFTNREDSNRHAESKLIKLPVERDLPQKESRMTPMIARNDRLEKYETDEVRKRYRKLTPGQLRRIRSRKAVNDLKP